MTTGIERIAAERRRQVEQEGFDAKHDDDHDDESIALAAAAYASPCPLYRIQPIGELSDGRPIAQEIVDVWPESWHESYDKREEHSRIRQLEIAGALIAAEIDRLIRAGEGES